MNGNGYPDSGQAETGGDPAGIAPAIGSPRLLVVDDSDNIHEDMRYILETETADVDDKALESLKSALFGDEPEQPRPPEIRYRMDDAWQGDEAIRMVREAYLGNDPYSIVFLDVNMPPGKDGIRVAGLLWEEDPHVEVVICTAYSDYTWEQVAALYGHSDHLLFVRKPFDSVSMKQIALSLSTKWRLARENRAHIAQLETEVKRRTAELEQTVSRLRTEMALRRDKEHQLARQAHYDTLTGLLNRYSFYAMVGKIAASVEKVEDGGHALLFVDIDGFKTVNDRFGHDTGDLLLVDIATRLREATGTQAVVLDAVVALLASAEPEQAVFRLGGDEFTVLLPPLPRLEIRNTAERILSALSARYVLRGREVQVACSIGVSILKGDAPDFGTLLKHADTAMYKAKEHGGAVVFHEDLRGTGWLDPTELAMELEPAIRAGHFENHYQHILDSEDQLVGMAAFARWRHERYGQVMPESFLPVAESLDLIALLERSILADACRQVASLTAREHRTLFVLVHCAAATLLEEDFPDFVRELRKTTGLAPGRLRIACDVAFVKNRPELAGRLFSELAGQGVRMVVEGVVDGQSIQSLVRTLPSGSMLQPARSLLVNLTTREGDRLFLLDLINRIRACGSEALVGGIETSAQAEVLTTLPVLRQGFLYGGPVPFDVFVREINRMPHRGQALAKPEEAGHDS